MRRMVTTIGVLAAVLIAGLLAWRAGEQARRIRESASAQEAAVQAAREEERLELEAMARPGEPLVERVRVEPSTLDFGDLLPDVQVTRMVRLRNIGDRAVRIVRAVADCSCTLPSTPPGPIPAGASVEVAIAVRPGATQGTRFLKRVTYEVEGALPATCTVEGSVGTYIRCAPESLDAPAVGAVAPDAELVLESALGIPFTVTEVEPSIDADGPMEPAIKQVVRIDWRLWRESGRPMQVTITTDHVGAPPISVLIRRHDEP